MLWAQLSGLSREEAPHFCPHLRPPTSEGISELDAGGPQALLARYLARRKTQPDHAVAALRRGKRAVQATRAAPPAAFETRTRPRLRPGPRSPIRPPSRHVLTFAASPLSSTPMLARTRVAGIVQRNLTWRGAGAQRNNNNPGFSSLVW